MAGFFTHSRQFTKAVKSLTRGRYTHSSVVQAFSQAIESGKNRFHIYHSRISDPYFNLSLEHYIYQKSHPDSTILLVYINSPCVVIGRNQVPWLEANLQAVSEWNMPLIRRRSGGGTVFHDHGNVNFSFILSPEHFTRSRYAEVVTAALRPSQPRARVNERNDIVIDQGKKLQIELQPEKYDFHRSAYEPGIPKKCSGSAYKLTRTRALHHGTCLINSPNLDSISDLLRSPLGPFVMARGVDSVRSPVCNAFEAQTPNPLGLFVVNLAQAFIESHDLESTDLVFKNEEDDTKKSSITFGPEIVSGLLSTDLLQIESIQKGMAELMSKEWLWGQTPKFTFSSYATEEDNRERPQLPTNVPITSRINFTARSGEILDADMMVDLDTVIDAQTLIGKNIQDFDSWGQVLKLKTESQSADGQAQRKVAAIAAWLDQLFGKTKH